MVTVPSGGTPPPTPQPQQPVITLEQVVQRLNMEVEQMKQMMHKMQENHKETMQKVKY